MRNSRTRMIPRNHREEDEELGDILKLIQISFAYMEGRIDPPSSMQSLTISDISEHCYSGEVWSLGDPVVACMFLKFKSDALYIGKLAVSENQRGKGIARKMIELADRRAQVHNKNYLELFTRIELTENHLVFSKLGFKKVAEAAHSDYEQSTYIIMTKPVSRS